MLLSHIADDVLFESGQFLTGGMECLGITTEQFWRNIVRRELRLYTKYRPLTYKFNRNAVSTGHGEAAIVFTDDPLSPTPLFQSFDPSVGALNTDPHRIPSWVSSVIPINSLTTFGILFLIQESKYRYRHEYSALHEPRPFLFRYESPILYTSEIGGMDIVAHYGYPYTELKDSNGVLTDVDIQYIDEEKDWLLIKLAVGLFLQAVGRSRRAFQYTEAPVQMDASELVSEGAELERTTLEELANQSSWASAIGI